MSWLGSCKGEEEERGWGGPLSLAARGKENILYRAGLGQGCGEECGERKKQREGRGEKERKKERGLFLTYEIGLRTQETPVPFPSFCAF